MNCIECDWDDSKAPQSGKCCTKCGLCGLCEQYQAFKQTTKVTEGSLKK